MKSFNSLRLPQVYDLSNITLGVIFLLNLYIFWPGILSPDSETQYAEARAGLYSDHHPALMSFLWRYFDKIIEGPP